MWLCVGIVGWVGLELVTNQTLSRPSKHKTIISIDQLYLISTVFDLFLCANQITAASIKNSSFSLSTSFVHISTSLFVSFLSLSLSVTWTFFCLIWLTQMKNNNNNNLRSEKINVNRPNKVPPRSFPHLIALFWYKMGHSFWSYQYTCSKQYKVCAWLDTNRKPLVSKAAALPTETQPPPKQPRLSMFSLLIWPVHLVTDTV